MQKGYVFFIRLFLIFICVFLGWSIYSFILYRELTFTGFQGQDYLVAIGFSIGLYAFIQLLLRYLSIPNVKITLADGPRRFGPSQELTIPADASEELQQKIRYENSKRQYAAYHIQVWNYDVSWWIRPLIQRVVVEGARARFRYTKIDDGNEELMLNSEWLLGRWNDNPQPLSPQYDLTIAVGNRRLTQLFTTERSGNIDAYPFSVAFAIKKEGEDYFYHFNDESYAWPGWSNRHWRLGLGTYRVDVRLTGYGLLGAVTIKYKLLNSGPSLSDWRLEKW